MYTLPVEAKSTLNKFSAYVCGHTNCRWKSSSEQGLNIVTWRTTVQYSTFWKDIKLNNKATFSKQPCDKYRSILLLKWNGSFALYIRISINLAVLFLYNNINSSIYSKFKYVTECFLHLLFRKNSLAHKDGCHLVLNRGELNYPNVS